MCYSAIFTCAYYIQNKNVKRLIPLKIYLINAIYPYFFLSISMPPLKALFIIVPFGSVRL